MVFTTRHITHTLQLQVPSAHSVATGMIHAMASLINVNKKYQPLNVGFTIPIITDTSHTSVPKKYVHNNMNEFEIHP